MVRYLEYYHKLPGYKAYSGAISDVSLDALVFSCGHETYTTPFQPPLTSFREVRERVVQMDKDCLAGLSRSDITVQEFVPSHGPYLALFLTVTATFVAFSTRANFESGGLVAAFVPKAFAHFCWTIQPFVFYPMVLIHGCEAYYMATGRLRRHSVNMRSKTWWQWVGTTFIEGVGAFNR